MGYSHRDADGTTRTFTTVTVGDEEIPAITEPPFSAVIAQGGVTVGTSSVAVRTADAARRYIEVSNHGDTDVSLRFAAAAAVVGEGGFLPAKSSNRWAYSGEVRAIRASGSGAVSFVAW